MRIIFLSNIETAILDIIAWVCFHLGIGYTCSKMPVDYFDPQKKMYQIREWEENGEFYQRHFRVRAWKGFIPSGASVYANTFKIKHLPTNSPEYLRRWIKESCRAEFCHWVMIIPGFLFFLWNSVEVGWWMVVYAFANNMVPIIMQRYNRPRIQKLLNTIEHKQKEQMELRVQFEPHKVYTHLYQ